MATKKDKFLEFINDKRYGGMSENEYLSNGINFSYGQNLDIYTNPKGVTLSKDFDAVTTTGAASWTTTGYITKTLRLPNDIQSNAYFTSTGEVWIEATANTPTLAYQMTGADKRILQAVCFGTYLIFFTAGALHRITFTGNDFKTFSAATESVGTFTGDYTGFATGDNYDFPVYNDIDAVLYFGVGTKLFSCPIGGLATISTEYTFAKGDKIVGLSYLNSNIKIYVNHCNTDSKLRFRSPATSDQIIYKNRVFKSVTTDGQIDYVVCSDGLFLWSGYNNVKVYDADFSTFGKCGSNYFVPQNLMGLNPYFWYIGHEYKLYKFGKRYTALKNGVVVDKLFTSYITSVGESIPRSEVMYVTLDNKKGYRKSTTKYNTTGYLETVVFYGDTMEKKKRVNRIFNAYQLASGETIQVYASVDGAAYGASPIFTISDNTVKWKEFFMNQLTGLTNHWIKIKIVLNSVSAYTTTPTLLEFDLFEDYIENI